jgi:hypothetical protein
MVAGLSSASLICGLDSTWPTEAAFTDPTPAVKAIIAHPKATIRLFHKNDRLIIKSPFLF